jgi:hypothetical protein
MIVSLKLIGRSICLRALFDRNLYFNRFRTENGHSPSVFATVRVKYIRRAIFTSGNILPVPDSRLYSNILRGDYTSLFVSDI